MGYRDRLPQLDPDRPFLARAHLPGVAVLGGCCGSAHRHVAQISDARQSS